MADAVYIHVPFCSFICAYCDFCKLIYNKDFADKYLDALEKEMKDHEKIKANSVYLGGGSPSSLNPLQLERLLKLGSYYLDKDYEYCIELNPENMDDTKIDLLKKYGINRVSIGVQTFHEKYLKLAERKHTKEDVVKLIDKLINVGIDNISVDLMFGFSNETKYEVEDDINEFMKLNIKHVSCYPLVIEKNTKFYINKIKAVDDDLMYEYYEVINKICKSNGFERYEISNFAKKGYESKHNLKYWRDKEYLGLGLGASGYLNDIRYDNTKSLNEYLRGNYVIHKELIKGNEKEFEYIMLNLRLSDGLDINEYRKLFAKDFKKTYANEIKKLADEGLLVIDSKRCYIAQKGVYLSNYVIGCLTSNLTYDKIVL